jgi:hypothetical protein
MAKKKLDRTKAAQGPPAAKQNQGVLFETLPKNLEKMRPLVDEYLEAKAQRLAAGAIESAQKAKIIPIILAAKLTPMANGHVMFSFAGVDWDVEPTGYSLHTKTTKEPKAKKAKD